MYQTSIPVLFITFARPEYARQTFDGIKKAKPSNLYFYSNKARIDKPDEIDRNNTIRAYLKEIDWECDIKTYFRDEYVDIYTSLWGAIDWVFENEEQAIILEEDCVPSLAFFDFCEQLLPQYKDDQRVWVISGNNFIEGFNPNNYDYFFSPFAYQYGWASWKSRWNRLNRKGFNVTKIIEYDLYKQLYSSRKAANHAYRQLKRYGENIGIWKPEAWDYVFQMSMRINGGFGIVPKVNLVSNIGVRYKSQETIIKSIPKLIKLGYDIEYHLIGDGNDLFLKSLANKFNILNRIKFIEIIPHNQVFDLLDNIDIYVHPSKQEGLPRAIIEAMSRACPVIGSNVGGIPELLKKECIFKAGSVKNFIKTFQTIINSNLKEIAYENFQKSKNYSKNILEKRRFIYYEKFKKNAQIKCR